MPRGVYDRSKSKEQRATEKAVSAAKPEKGGKRKYTKRAVAAAAPELPLAGTVAHQEYGFHNDLALFTTFSSALAGVNSVNPALANKLTAKINTIVDRLAPDAPAIEKVAEKVAERKAEAVAAPPVPAPSSIPVPIPVPIPFNGSSPQ